MPYVNRLDLAGWYYCPVHNDMEYWSYGSCISRVDIPTWDDYIKYVALKGNSRLTYSMSYPKVEHGPDPIMIR